MAVSATPDAAQMPSHLHDDQRVRARHMLAQRRIGQGRGQHNFAKDVPATRPQRNGRAGKTGINILGAADHIEHHGVECAQKDYKGNGHFRCRPKDDGDGHPRQRRNGPQYFKRRKDNAF